MEETELDRLIREQEADASDSVTAYDHSIFRAPWREVYGLLGGRQADSTRPRYGPWYLPTSYVTGSPISQTKAESEHAEGRYPFSGGLWDHSQGSGVPARAVLKSVERADLEVVKKFVALYSGDIGNRELQVYVAFWVEGRSYKSTAAHLGMSAGSIRQLVGRLRKRVRKNGLRQRGDDRPGPGGPTKRLRVARVVQHGE